MFPDVKTQLDIIRRGAEEIFPEDELVQKIERSKKENRPLRVKLGIDPTATDIHLGFAVVLRKLRQFQDLGHKAVIIIGDYTAQVGDPSGKNKTRPMLTHEEVLANAETYLQQMNKIIDVSAAEIVRNGDWFSKMTFLDVIKLTSRTTVARMLERDDFLKRYQNQTPIGLHEFLYPLMQGWDSVEVRADVELGGTDQRFNLLVGRDLQRDVGQEPQICLTLPLLIGTDGSMKMSKSLGNYIGIDEPPSEMFGKLMSIPDELMRSYFILETELPESEIDQLLAGHPRDAKLALARTIVAMYHGDEAAASAQEEFIKVFSRKDVPDEMPEVVVGQSEIWIIDLIRKAGFASSNSEARRLVIQGGVSIDGEPVRDPSVQVTIHNDAVLKVGKRRFAKLRVG